MDKITPDEKRDPRHSPAQLNERGVNEYVYLLGVDEADFKDKTVLNIGAGVTGIFDKKIALIAKKMFSVSPFFAAKNISGEMMRDEYRLGLMDEFKKYVLKKDIQWPEAFPAWAHKLHQIRDGSIDIYLALYSVPLYAEETEFPELFSEIIRILDNEGIARLYPVSGKDKIAIEEILNNSNSIKYKFVALDDGMSGSSGTVYNYETPYRLEIVKLKD